VQRTITVAVAGNPNAGKTTIFNNLTGARQHVGNYPGVTVEWTEGSRRIGDVQLRVIDLPGTYSLSAYSEEERVARDFLLEEKPDVVLNVVDAANLERNLYLTTELMELGRPLVIALNMSDEAEKQQIVVDRQELSQRIGAPVIRSVGNRGEGTHELLEALLDVAIGGNGYRKEQVDFGGPVEQNITRLKELIASDTLVRDPADRRWLAIKLLEKDRDYLDRLGSHLVRAEVTVAVEEFASATDGKPEVVMARHRYSYIEGILYGTVEHTRAHGRTWSDRIDDIVMHPVWGLPIFALLMFLVFSLAFTLGNPLMDGIEGSFGWLGDRIAGFWPAGAESPLQSLLVDGVIGGVGGVIVFLPNIVLLFLAIAILEGTGYMVRAAFVMDRFMSKVGLHGKSFIPLLIGFGCTVPAIMATRTLENRRDRITTMLVLPLISCGARLPIYALIIPAFFPQKWQGPVLWVIYFTGIALALLGAKLLRMTVFRGETTPFVMELPPYRFPTGKSLLLQMWTRAWLYLKKAGTVILGASIIMWFLTSYPKPPTDYLPPADFDLPVAAMAKAETATPAVTPAVTPAATPPAASTARPPGEPSGEPTREPTGEPASKSASELATTPEHRQQAAELAYSVSGRIGHLIEPVLRPMGFDWRIGTALVGAFAAKEVFVAQMGIVFAVGETDEHSEGLRAQLRARYTPLIGFCILLFALIATPCMATIAVTRQESGSWRWALAQFWGLTVFAWLLTTVVYQLGSRLLA